MNKIKLSDDELLNLIRETRAWQERDAQRTLKYQRLIRLAGRKRRIRQAIGVSTGIGAIFLIVIFTLWSGNKTKIDSNTLYAQYYEPFHFAVDYRDGSQDSIGIFKQAIISYRAQEWNQAGLLADSLTKIEPTNPNYLLLNGLVMQAQGKFDKAIKQYLALIRIGGSYGQHARWYLSLLFLEQGKLMECRSQLDTLKLRTSSFYGDKAEALLKKMDRL
jgi:tetratricopeptide (TPR) repeat protein